MTDFIGIYKSTTLGDIVNVTSGLVTLAPQYIKMFSTEEEISEAITKFYNIIQFTRFPQSLVL